MRYALLLNDMREPKIENIQVVRVSADPDELAAWYTGQLAGHPWKDGRWEKAFRQGSDLEWFNPVADIGERNGYWGGIWEDTPDFVVVGHRLMISRP